MEHEVRYLEDVRVGDQIGPSTRVVTTEMVRQFCRAWGSRMPNRFTDDQVARAEGLPHALLPGIMSMGLAATLLGRWAPGSKVRRLETLFRRPVPHNQPLRLAGAVTAKDSNTVECEVHLQGEDGEPLATSSATLILASREEL